MLVATSSRPFFLANFATLPILMYKLRALYADFLRKTRFSRGASLSDLNKP